MIIIDKLTERKSELIEARFNAQRLFNQLDGRIQEIEAMILFLAQTRQPDSNDIDLDEGQVKTITTP